MRKVPLRAQVFVVLSVGQRTGNGKGKSEMRGSLHCAAHDKAVSCFGRDDEFFGAGRRAHCHFRTLNCNCNCRLQLPASMPRQLPHQLQLQRVLEGGGVERTTATSKNQAWASSSFFSSEARSSIFCFSRLAASMSWMATTPPTTFSFWSRMGAALRPTHARVPSG